MSKDSNTELLKQILDEIKAFNNSTVWIAILSSILSLYFGVWVFKGEFTVKITNVGTGLPLFIIISTIVVYIIDLVKLAWRKFMYWAAVKIERLKRWQQEREDAKTKKLIEDILNILKEKDEDGLAFQEALENFNIDEILRHSKETNEQSDDTSSETSSDIKPPLLFKPKIGQSDPGTKPPLLFKPKADS